ncbi:MAG TPA: FadR/GntR family transcriptional regulator [Egibacteraceae bacterium]|nr:FadR/GntR family transcriptional regulator [Egibacteraceae bacterium]
MSLTEQAIQKIKEMIVTGELGPGDRLPKEQDLAERIGLSRNSLREAIRALSLIRVLDVRQGDGTYVTSLSPDLLLEAMGFVMDLHRDDTVVQFLEVRRILEPAATATAAGRISEDVLAQLAKLIESMGAPDATIETLVADDLEFHRLVVSAAGNPVLTTLLESLSGMTTRARVWRGLTQEGAAERTVDEHRAILDALKAGQPEVARAWATVHVAGVEEWLRRAL